MPATLTTASAILKEIYEPNIQEQLQNDMVALKRIQKSSVGVKDDVGGKYVIFPVHTRRNSGIGARNEQEALPAAGQQGWSRAQVGLRYLYGRVSLTGQSMRLVDKNYQAFASILTAELEGLQTDLQKDLNRQVYGTGNGAVATASASGSGVNTVTVYNGQYIQLGMQVDLIDGSTLSNTTPTVKASNRQLTNFNTSTNVATLDGATFSPAINDIIVRTGNVNREWAGFGSIVSDTSVFQNLDPATEGYWKSVIQANGGTNRPLSEGLLILCADLVRQNGQSVTAMFSNLGVRRAYFNLLVQQRRYTNTKEFTGGFTGLAFTTDKGDIPFVVDIDCPPNRVYGINEDAITLYRDADWQFMDEDGSKWQRVVGYDAYEATMFQYSQLGTHRRNAHFLLSDITEG